MSEQGSNAIFTGPQKGLTIIGESPTHCYAYSGIVEATGSGTYTDYLNFNTGKGYIKARIMVQYGEPSSDNLEWQVLFNNSVIANSNSQVASTSNTMPDFVDLIIPPLTNFVWQLTNSSSSTGRDVTCTFTGQVMVNE